MTTRIAPPKINGGWANPPPHAHRGHSINPTSTYTGFRPRIEMEGAYFVLRNWCNDPRINKTLSAVWNSLMIPLKIACEQTTQVDDQGQVSIELNIGRITIE